MDQHLLLKQLGIALLLGLLVGLQRERAAHGRPGMRTFPLITVFGTVCGILAIVHGGWIIVGGLLAVTIVIATPHLLAHFIDGDKAIGSTTDMAAVLMFAVGALLPSVPLSVGVAVGGGVAVLLQFKLELHSFAERLGRADLKAIMQFVLISCIILPVLPNRTFGPLEVLNPFETWMMVVLIVGMSLFGYILYKFLGRDAGILLGGILGGMISSTATTASYSRQSKGDGASATAIVILIASTIVFVRVLVEIAVVSPAFLLRAAAPIVTLMGLVMLPALLLWYRVRTESSPMPEQENPTQLKSAVTFGALYALVRLGLAAAQQYVGSEGLVFVAALSGLTDMDAITLSTARLANSDPEVMAEGWRLIVVGALANLVFKAGIVAFLAERALFWRVVRLFTIPLVGGIFLLLLWPAA